ncbi:hypothetical protein Ddc_21465 [Ditylenchus destructor]|nr:hypothetical protein Ddc_21465 [Ditylenchus destructor]
MTALCGNQAVRRPGPAGVADGEVWGKPARKRLEAHRGGLACLAPSQFKQFSEPRSQASATGRDAKANRSAAGLQGDEPATVLEPAVSGFCKRWCKSGRSQLHNLQKLCYSLGLGW